MKKKFTNTIRHSKMQTMKLNEKKEEFYGMQTVKFHSCRHICQQKDCE